MTIDDNSVDQMLYKRVIGRSGIVGNVIAYRSAEEALDYLKSEEREEIDVILLDINMPNMTGFEFLEHAARELGNDYSRLVVIMLTTSLDPKDKMRAEQYEVVRAYLNKPLSIEDLQSIAHLLEKVDG